MLMGKIEEKMTELPYFSGTIPLQIDEFKLKDEKWQDTESYVICAENSTKQKPKEGKVYITTKMQIATVNEADIITAKRPNGMFISRDKNTGLCEAGKTQKEALENLIKKLEYHHRYLFRQNTTNSEAFPLYLLSEESATTSQRTIICKNVKLWDKKT
jgi:hypothetical protein